MNVVECFKIYKITDISSLMVGKIIDIQAKLAIGQKLIAKGETMAESGLLISGYSMKDFETFFESGGAAYVAFDESSGMAVGYFLSNSPESFTPKYEAAVKIWKKEEFRKKYDRMILNNDYVYGDQLGVLFEYHKTGAAFDLLRAFENDNEDRTVIALIMSKPIDNVRSKEFARKCGFTTIAEIRFEKYGTIKNFYGDLITKEL